MNRFTGHGCKNAKATIIILCNRCMPFWKPWKKQKGNTLQTEKEICF